MKNDQEIFADNAAPFNTIKLLSTDGGCVKKHIVDIAAQTVSKESQLIAQSTKSVTIVKYQVNSIVMSNDTNTLFVANDNGITQFQKEDYSLNYYPVRIFKGHIEWINSISLSNSKMHLLSASYDDTLRVWDLENGTQLACLNQKGKEHQPDIRSCCWNNKDSLFASGDMHGDVVVWSPPLSKYNASNQFVSLCKFKVEGDTSCIGSLKFQENGLDLFASYRQSGVIRLWSINEKELLESKSNHQQNATLPLIQQPKRQSEKLDGWINSFDVRGSLLVATVFDVILLFSADSFQIMADQMKFDKVQNNHIMSSAFSKDGKYAASGSANRSVTIFDSKSGKCLKIIKGAHSKCWVRAVVFEI